MRFFNYLFAVVALAPVLLSGCATVDPHPDYERVGGLVQKTSGHPVGYRPGRDDQIESLIGEMLADGLSLDEAVRIALLNNPEVQGGFFDVGMARADVVQAGLWSNPTLGVSAQFPSGGGLANIEASLAQSIVELWQIPIRREVAERSLDQVVLRLARRIAEIARETKSSYHRAVAATKLHEIAGEHARIASELLDLARLRQEAGAGTAVDVNLAQGVVLEADLARQAARLEEADAMRVLAKLLGLTTDASTLVLRDELASEPVDVSFDDAVTIAGDHRLDLEAGRQVVAGAEANLRLEWRRVFPAVEIGLGLERAERKSQGGRDILADTARASIRERALTAPEIEPRSSRDRDTDLIIGPSLSIELPLFDQNQAGIAKAAFAYERSRKELESLARGIVQDVRGAVDRTRTARAVVTLFQDELLPLAGRSLELSRASYQAGKSSFLSVLEAQRFLLATKRGQVAALRDLATSLVTLEGELGVPVSDIEAVRAAHETPIEND
jgi:cobalt-zinc-cadmium efflux system outer membrane protein